MLDVRRLRLLRELAQRGTITAVAQALSFTPSAVSQQLSALEREAGLPLLERSGRRVVLTPAGHALVRRADVVLEELERAAAELAGARQGLAGPLRVGTFASAGRTMIPAALVALGRQHPGLEPMVRELDPAGVAGALRAGELDVALIHEYDFAASRPEPGLAAEPLCTEAMFLARPAGSAGSAASGDSGDGGSGDSGDGDSREGGSGDGGAAAIGGARDASWITATPGTMCHQMTIHACQAAGFTPRVRHQVDDFTTMLALVAVGQGVALLPQLGLDGAPPGVALTRVPLHRRTQVAYRSGADRHPAVTAVIAALRSAIPPALHPAPAPASLVTRSGDAGQALADRSAQFTGEQNQSNDHRERSWPSTSQPRPLISPHPSRRPLLAWRPVTDDLADREPDDPPFTAPEQGMLEAWLDYHRATLLLTCDGLTDEQRKRRPISTSLMSLHGLVRHLADVERNWFERPFDRPGVPPIFRRADVEDADWFPLDNADWAADLAVWRSQCAQSKRIAATCGLDDVGAGLRGGQPGEFSLRWCYNHMIEEYARHNGHADLIRELIDNQPR